MIMENMHAPGTRLADLHAANKKKQAHTPICKYRQTRTLCGTIQTRTSEPGHTTRTSSTILWSIKTHGRLNTI